MNNKKDYYESLGVARDASQNDIKSAYRKLAMKYHPDKNSGNKESEDKFKEVTEAYEVLSNDTKRAQYDQYGHAAFQYGGQGGAGFGGMNHAEEVFRSFMDGFGGGTFDDILGGFFGGGSTGTRRRRNSRGSDLEMSIEITFEESAFGAGKNIRVPRYETCNVCKGDGAKPGTNRQKCPQCGGSGQVMTNTGFFSLARTCSRCNGEGEIIQTPCTECRGQGRTKVERKIDVKIHAGVENGTTMRITGEGEAGRRGGPRGDLYIHVYVKKHAIFQREGTNVICQVPISFVQATLGAEVDVPTIEGNVKMKIPAGTQNAKIFRLRGKGITDLRGYSRGDELVRIVVEVPTRLNANQKKLLKEFEASGGGVTPLVNGFVEKIRRVFK